LNERSVIPRDRVGAAGGFTLLEIGIALVVLALAFSLALPGLEAVTGARMRSAAGHLSSSMRALYSEAALTGRTCRIAFNLDDRSYTVECAQGAARISSVKEEVRDGQRYRDLKKEQDEIERLRDLAKDNPIQAQLEAKTAYLTVPGVAKVTLPDGVFFQSIWVQHQAEKVVAGDAFLYFFPQGNTEHALITLKRGDDLLTVESNSLTGRVQLIDGAIEAPKS
jgi:general secretion pathway protein H